MPSRGTLHGRTRRKTFFPDGLARDFGAGCDATRRHVRTLYEIIASGDQPDALAALQAWRPLISGPCGHGAEEPATAIAGLADFYGTPREGLRPAAMTFALHTYYALLVKLLVWHAVASVRKVPLPIGQIRGARCGSDLRQQIECAEAGRILQALNPARSSGGEPFSWYLGAWDERIGRMIRHLADRFGQYDWEAIRAQLWGGRDLLKGLYGSLFPRRFRHLLGEYYTPDWLAAHVLDEVGYRGRPGTRLLDPACGSGTFLVMAIRRIRARYEASAGRQSTGAADLCREILNGAVGFDVHPLAVLSARANYLVAVCDLLGDPGPIEIPVFLQDSILSDPGGEGGCPGGRFDYVVGNPPWIAWDDLPSSYRQATKPLWKQYGLFTLSGSDARHGGGKKDLSMLVLYAAADRHLKQDGRLGMVVTQSLFQTKGAGDGFRRFRLGSRGAWLRVLRVDDLVDLRPFFGAANWTATVVLQKGRRTTYPVPYLRWSGGGGQAKAPADAKGSFRRRCYRAEPIDPARPTSPWFLRPPGLETELARLIGPSQYEGHLGANTGGANGVYWVELLEAAGGHVRIRNIAHRAKRGVAAVEQLVEPDLLRPLLRWADVTRYRAVPSAHLLLVQDVWTRRGIEEAELRRGYPKTYAYLTQFAAALSGRAAYRRYQARSAFYSMYNVGRYTVAPVKVVWRRMDRRINAAVVEPVDDPLLGIQPVVPQETCVLIAPGSADAAHYLCALLNSSIVNFLAISHSVRGGKGFGTPSMLDFLRLRRFDPTRHLHAELAASSRRAHHATQQGEDLTAVQEQIDELAGRLWELSRSELRVIDRELEQSGPERNTKRPGRTGPKRSVREPSCPPRHLEGP